MGDYDADLPPGFRFFPSDEELVVHFLRRKASHLPCQPNIIPTLDLHLFDPWDLNGNALQGGNQVWYFFSRNAQHRATPSGCWSPVGISENITNGDQHVGVKKTLVFFFGENKTNWVMHEYHLLDAINASTSNTRRSSSKKRSNPRTETNKWIICRVYDSSCGSQSSFQDGGRELSCLDEVFLSFDDLDEVSLPD
ncbi:NAC domain-containing protein 104 [Asparagus officinalis]|uniref:NAC domain-containing protein 104 n=1 Tax=Asparagus officinalis TaxID=4686 RepID=UPI00098E2B05|nr:NAC domain-containing protein 104 [Asparagus officinalis]